MNAWQRLARLDDRVGERHSIDGDLVFRTLADEDYTQLGELAADAMDVPSVQQTLAVVRLFPRLAFGIFVADRMESFAVYRLGLVLQHGRIRPAPFLYWVATAPAKRSTGLGLRILSESLSLLQEIYRSPCELLVARGSRAQSLYERLGFAEISDVAGRPGICLMRKECSTRGGAIFASGGGGKSP